MKHLKRIALRFGLPMIISLIMMIIGFQGVSAHSSTAVITGTSALTTPVGGPPVGGQLTASAQITATQVATIVVDAPWFTVSPFDETWGNWFRVTNYTVNTQTIIVNIYAADEFGQPGLDYLEVHIDSLGTCEYNDGHNEAECTFDIAPNYYWDIYIDYDLNSVANPPHWEIFHCLRHMCDKTNVYFPPYFTATIYLPAISKQ